MKRTHFFLIAFFSLIIGALAFDWICGTSLTGATVLLSAIPAAQLYGDANLELGKISKHHPTEYVRSFAADGTIVFGRALARKSAVDYDRCKTLSGTDAFLGVAGWSPEASDLNNEQYLADDPVGVIEAGFPVCFVEEAVDPGDPVRVRIVAGASGLAGNFCTTAEAGKTAVLANAEFDGVTTGAGPVSLYLKPGPHTLTPDA